MKLEDKITRGRVTYINSFIFDVIKKQVQINFSTDPGNNSITDMTVIFNKISSFIMKEDEDEEDLRESIIGIDEYNEATAMKYVITTDIKTITFNTTIEPIINEIQ